MREDERCISPCMEPGPPHPPGLYLLLQGRHRGAWRVTRAPQVPSSAGEQSGVPAESWWGPLCPSGRSVGAGRVAGRLPGSAAHFKVCRAKREAPELFQDNFLFHREVPQGESCPQAGRARPVISGRAGTGEGGLSRALPLIPQNQPCRSGSSGMSRSRGRRGELPCRRAPRAGATPAALPPPRRGRESAWRLHTLRLEINSVATRDKEESVQGDTFPAPRSKRRVLCLCQRLPPGASRAHLLSLTANPCSCPGQPLPAASTGMQPG